MTEPGIGRYLAKTLRGWPMVGLVVSFLLMVLAAWTAILPAALLGRLIDGIDRGTLDTFFQATPILVAISGCIVASEVASWAR